MENKEEKELSVEQRAEIACPHHSNPDDYNYPNSAVIAIKRGTYVMAWNDCTQQKQQEFVKLIEDIISDPLADKSYYTLKRQLSDLLTKYQAL